MTKKNHSLYRFPNLSEDDSSYNPIMEVVKRPVKIIFVSSLWNTKNKLAIPIGLLSLMTVLDEKGYDTELIDFNYLYKIGQLEKSQDAEKNIHYMAECILQSKPDLIGFNNMCSSSHINIILTKYIKERHPDLPIIFGGPQTSVTAQETLERFPWIDLIAIGEAELTIEKIVQSFQGQASLEEIPGIAYRDGDQIMQNSELDLIADLDTLPMLNYSLIPFIDELSSIYIEAGRGCPFNCIYCSTKTFWKRKFRLKSAQRLVSEIKTIHQQYQISEFSLIHDLFVYDKPTVKEFCTLLEKENLPIKWACSARIDILDEELIQTMSQAGCQDIFLGIETGSPRMQRLIKKNLDLNDAWQKIKLLKKHGIAPNVSFIYGFPDETLEDVQMTLKMIKHATQLGIKTVQLHLLSVLVGTELYENHQNDLVYDQVLSDVTNNLNLEVCEDYIIQYPQIFPHFYNLNFETRAKLQNLDQFIAAYFVALYEDLTYTFKYLLEHYNGDLLEFFFEMRKYVPRFDLEARYNHTYLYSTMTPTDVAILKFECLRELLHTKDFGADTDQIRQMFQFEYAIFKFLHLEDAEPTETHEFKYDLFTAKKENLPLQEVHTHPVRLVFERYQTDKLKIKKFDLAAEQNIS